MLIILLTSLISIINWLSEASLDITSVKYTGMDFFLKRTTVVSSKSVKYKFCGMCFSDDQQNYVYWGAISNNKLVLYWKNYLWHCDCY